MSKKLYEESKILDIANAIRERCYTVTNSMNVSEMAETIRDLMYQTSLFRFNENVDDLGKWHKPEEWDDIESVEIPEGNSEIYILCNNHNGTGESFVRLRVYGSGLTWQRGHIIDSQFVAKTDVASVSSGSYISINLEEIEELYSVLKISGTSISGCYTTEWNGTNKAYSVAYNSVLMRYGRMPKGTNITFLSYYLESDNILDFASDLTNTSLTLASAYASCYRLARWRHTNWNITSNYTTSINSMFTYCMSLIDVPSIIDMTSWVTSKTTNCGSIFYFCLSLKDVINVTNWDISNVTTFNSTFYLCRSLRNIIGIDTWNAATKCIRTDSMFSNTYNLNMDLNISNMKCGTGTVAFTNPSSMFSGCGAKTINCGGWDFSKVTTNMTYVFSNMLRCTEVLLGGCVWPTAATTLTLLFYNNYCLKNLELDGIDFSSITKDSTTGILYIAYNNYNLRKFLVINAVPMKNSYKDTSSSYGSFFYNCWNLEYLDASWIDFSLFTGTYSHLYAFRNCYKLVDFYPPINISKSFYISTSPMLSHDSLIRIVNNLVDHSGDTGTYTLTIGSINRNKLTTNEQQLVLNKGWTFA